MAGAGAAVGAGGQSPQLTGGAGGASGDIRSETGIDFGTLNIGGVLGSGARSSRSDFLVPALIAGAVVLGFLFLKKR